MANRNSKKEDFFKILNLVSTKKVRVKYCRTIKERLRPSTMDESLTLPVTKKSPSKRKPEDDSVELKGGLCLLESYKSRKKSRKKSPVTPPCSKSLLSFLHSRLTAAESSSEEEEQGAVQPGQLSNGFSREAVRCSQQQQSSLQHLISHLETGAGPGPELEVVAEQRDLVMQMVEDFGLMSETDSECEEVKVKEEPGEKMLEVKLEEKPQVELDCEWREPGLSGLVARVRRELRAARRAREQRECRDKAGILARCDYWQDEEEAGSGPAYTVRMLPGLPGGGARLGPPSSHEVELARRLVARDPRYTAPPPARPRYTAPPPARPPTQQRVQRPCQVDETDGGLEHSQGVVSAEDAAADGDNEELNVWSAQSVQAVKTEEICRPGLVEVASADTADVGSEFEGNMQRDGSNDTTPRKFPCIKCGKQFSTKNGLDYHDRIHLGLAPYECDVCLKRFKSSSLCSRHKQIHAVTKKYSCHICRKSFSQKSNLSKHMDIHAGKKPYQVTIIIETR